MFTQMPNFAEGGFEFLRKLWGGGFAGMAGGMPNMASFAAPPMDLEELDKRIHDLRAVESWLQLNASLLRTAIQGLEVQRATLVALQTFGSALSPEAMKSAFDGFAGKGETADEASDSKPAWPHTSTAQSAKAEEPSPEDEEDVASEDTDDDEAQARAEASQAAQAQAAAARAAAAALDPSPWWNMLQQQFNQIASSAAAAMPMPQNLMPGFAGFGGAAGGMGAPGAEGLDTAPEEIEEKTAPAKPKRAAAKSAPKPAAKAPAGKTAKPVPKKTAAKKAPAKAAPPKLANDDTA